MGEYIGKQLVYLIQKQGRDIHPEKKRSMGTLSNEERECSKSETRQRHSRSGVQSILSEKEHSKGGNVNQ